MKPIMYANLHNHTTHSDGVYSPAELARIAKAEGYGAVAVTDHDAATGYPELKAECEKLGLESTFGCEFTGYSEELDYTHHITAFDFDPEYPEMKEYLYRCGASITNQTQVLFERGVKDGFIPEGISWDDVLEYNAGIGWLCNDHVFRAMKNKGLATDLDYPAFFNNVFATRRKEVKLIYQFLPLKELLELIIKAGGIACVAHPSHRLGDIPRLMEYGISGLEVWHNGIVRSGEIGDALRVALENNLYISGGEDHSGLCGGQYGFYEDPKATRFWCEPCSLGTTKEFFEEIRDRRLNPDRADYINKYLEEYI